MEKNAETVNLQNEEQARDAAASAAEPVEERARSNEREAVEATDVGEADAVASGDEAVATDDTAPIVDELVDAEAVDETSALKEALAQAEAQANEYLDGWQRARAEFANYRRREELRREQSAGEIAGRVLGHFLPVLDDLERAFSSVPPEVQDSSWVEGLSLVAQKMLTGIEKEGVAVMATQEGDAFDPKYHMAVLHTPCAEYDEGQIAMVLQRGYTLGDRVLRPAMVQVSSGKVSDDGAESADAESADEASIPCEGEPEAPNQDPERETDDLDVDIVNSNKE